MSNTAIILAAGNGTRMKADKSKLLLEIKDMTVIERTVKTFSSIDEIDASNSSDVALKSDTSSFTLVASSL